MEAATTAAPWEAVLPHEQLFVLITGANSGIGLGTARRLIDEFLATRSPTAHLVLLPTTRSADKCAATVRAIRAHAEHAAQTWASTRGRYAVDEQRSKTEKLEDEDADDTPLLQHSAAARIHVLSLQLDLCDLRGVRALARRLTSATVSNPPGLEDVAYGTLRGVRIPRLDSVIFNAAYGGWTGFAYLGALWSILTKGFVHSVTWPDYKIALPTCLLNERPAYRYPPEPPLSEVFTACVFGHYILAHELVPLLQRSSAAEGSPPLAPGRIIWSSSLEAVADVFSPDDLQALHRPAYESAKRLTDILALTAALPAARPHSARWLAGPDDTRSTRRRRPNIYLTHPGIVASTIFPVPWLLLWAYQLSLLLCRLLGSPWHTSTSYAGAKAATWVALQPQEALDAMAAARVKWGSCADPRGRAVRVKKTEVEGWGWQGRVESALDDEEMPVVDLLRKRVGRKVGVGDVSEEDLVRFEELGAECWRGMEALRRRWEILEGEG